MNSYKYRPFTYFCTVLVLTWAFWLGAAFIGPAAGDGIRMLLLILGLFVPTVTTLVTVFTSKCPALKRDFKEKLFGLSRVKPLSIILSPALMGVIIVASILLSLLFGQPVEQFSFVGDFSFSLGGVPTLLTLVLTATLEELGWRGYAQDSLADRYNWFKASVIFGAVWALWHVPLFLIPGTYQHGILQLSPWYMVNFFVGIPPMAVLFTWLYAKNGRSIFACMFFHFAVNFLQEQVAMTDITKCVETAVTYAVAAAVVMLNRELFFGGAQVGRVLGPAEHAQPE